ncbi:MAG: phosphatase [Bacteroidota bacterium]|nr:phosphatase [Bacteroidota bacterium]
MSELFIANKIESVAEIFDNLGGTFIESPKVIAHKLKQIDCFVFDWDGVFNDGRKGAESSSDFAEPDSMATHILRYAYWLTHNKLPIVAIITGQNNESAQLFAEREHLNYVFSGFKNKEEPIKVLMKENKLQKEQISSMFDDIIDYPLAVNTGVRFLVNREENPLFTNYFIDKKLCEYITYSTGSQCKVREVVELIIGLSGNYNHVLESRFKDPEKYMEFWNLRQSTKTKLVKNTN